jgi:hypothetical protein
MSRRNDTISAALDVDSYDDCYYWRRHQWSLPF